MQHSGNTSVLKSVTKRLGVFFCLFFFSLRKRKVHTRYECGRKSIGFRPTDMYRMRKYFRIHVIGLSELDFWENINKRQLVEGLWSE